MDNFLNTVSEVYKKFGLENTSVSENKLPEDVRFFQRIVLTKKEKELLPKNASLTMGTLIHEAVQKMICHGKTLNDVIYKDQDSLIKKVRSYKSLDDKDHAKSRLVAIQAKKIVTNFVKGVESLQDKGWKSELEYVHWDNRIGTYFRIFVDAVGEKYFIDFKNLFGSVRQTKKGWSISSRSLDAKLFSSDIMQMALYSKVLPNHKPCLIYATVDGVKCFHPDNTPEMKPEYLHKAYEELILYQRQWELKLKIANGDVKTLAMLVKTDFSSIRKQDFWWKNIPQEYIDRLKTYYA
jgi:hypothetical protein